MSLDSLPTPDTFRDGVTGAVNTPAADITANIRRNMRRPLPQVARYEPTDAKAVLLCSGPSINACVRELKAKRRHGWKLWTVNGSHDWALDHGLVPSVHVQVDARAFNTRFLRRSHPDTRYILASQCHPSAFDALEAAGRDVTIMHAPACDGDARLLARYYLGRVGVCPGGGTVGTRALMLAYMLGIRRVAVYGMDCSLSKDERHHAMEQPENDRPAVHDVRVGRKRFLAHTWMVGQLDDVMQMAGALKNDYRVSFHGDGTLMAEVCRRLAADGKVPRVRLGPQRRL